MTSLPPGLAWVPSSHGRQVEGAVIGGNERGGMYVGRVRHRSGDVLPGKVHCEYGVIYVPWGGKEHNASSYEVLTQENPSNPTIHWVRSEGSGERVPPLAIQGGYISSTGEPLYIGRIRLNSGVVCCGKVHPSHGALYIPYGGKEHAFKQGYEILVARDRRPPRPPPPLIQNRSIANITTQLREGFVFVSNRGGESIAQSNRTTPIPNPLSASISVPPPLPSPEKPNPEGTLVCQICFENFNGNWGLVHGRTMHAGYCEGCAEKLKKDKLPCPQCRSEIEAVIKVFMN